MTDEQRAKLKDDIAHHATSMLSFENLREIYFKMTRNSLDKFSDEGLFDLEKRILE